MPTGLSEPGRLKSSDLCRGGWVEHWEQVFLIFDHTGTSGPSGGLPSSQRCGVARGADANTTTHQGAALWARPIHSAHAALLASAKPANRTPQSPPARLGAAGPAPPRPLRRSQSQGPSNIETPLPRAKSAITPAPCQTCPVRAATNSAEYSRPQGRNVHKAPTTTGIPRPRSTANWRACAHRIRPSRSSHTGCCVFNSKRSPTDTAATCKRLQTGRSAADCTVNQPKPCIEAAESPPKAE